MVVNSSTSTAEDGTASSVRNYSQSAGCSTEQILTPVSIKKIKTSSDATPGFRPAYSSANETGPFGGQGVGSVGPTIHELDPYFTNILGENGGMSNFFLTCDYNVIISDPSTDTNLKKNANRNSTEGVRTQALRGPLILSGWGFDIGDMPVPSNPDNMYTFDSNLASQRSYWKTGPVHLMWDDQRQVWCGGHQIVCGTLGGNGLIEAPRYVDEPTTFVVEVMRRDHPSYSWIPNISAPLSYPLGETITVVNRDPGLSFRPTSQANNYSVFVIAIRLNYEWLPLYVGCPDKN